MKQLSLKERALRGSGWTILGFGGSQFLRLLSNLVLTRLLFPEAFGLMALVQVCLMGIAMFSDVGLRVSIIQNDRGDDPAFLDTAWTLQIARGMLLWLVACALALPAAAFYGESDLAYLLPVAGLSGVIDGFTPTRVASANRHLLLGRVVMIELGGQVLGIVSMVGLALVTRSVWALLVGGMLGSLAKLASSFLWLPGHRNRLHWERQAVGELMGFGKYLFISTIAGFLINQGDRALLGKYVTLSDLALYNIAFMLANVPLMLGRQLSSRIILPLYRTKPPSESAENRRKLSQARMLLSGGLFALSLPLALGGDLIVRTLYDSRYHGAGAILSVMSLSTLLVIVSASYDSMLLAKGNSRTHAGLLVASACIRFTVLFIGVKHLGLMGAVITPAVAEIFTYPLRTIIIHVHSGWDPRHDAIFFAATAIIAWLAIQLNAETLQTFLNLG